MRKPYYAHALKGEKDVYFLTAMKKPKKGVYLIICVNCFKTPQKKLCISKLDPRKVVDKIGKPVRWLICGHKCWKER